MSTSKLSAMEDVPDSPQVIGHNYFIIPITFERGFQSGRLGTQLHKDSENYGTAGIKPLSRRCGLIQQSVKMWQNKYSTCLHMSGTDMEAQKQACLAWSEKLLRVSKFQAGVWNLCLGDMESYCLIGQRCSRPSHLPSISFPPHQCLWYLESVSTYEGFLICFFAGFISKACCYFAPMTGEYTDLSSALPNFVLFFLFCSLFSQPTWQEQIVLPPLLCIFSTSALCIP